MGQVSLPEQQCKAGHQECARRRPENLVELDLAQRISAQTYNLRAKRVCCVQKLKDNICEVQF